MHFVGKRRGDDLAPGEDGGQLGQRQRRRADEQPWNDDDDDDDDDDVLRASDDDGPSTSAGDDEHSDTAAAAAAAGSARHDGIRRQPMILLALRRVDGRHDQLLRDSAKKGARHEAPVSDRSSELDGRDVMTLNVLTRKPTTIRLPAGVKHSDVLPSITSQSRESRLAATENAAVEKAGADNRGGKTRNKPYGTPTRDYIEKASSYFVRLRVILLTE